MTPLRAIALGGGGIALLAALLVAILAPRRNVAQLPVLRGTPVDPPKTAVDFMLTGTDGRPAHIIDRNYRATFLFFGYTHCPDACPLAMASLQHAYRALQPAQASLTRIVFITVDPKRDGPAALGRYVASFRARVVGLTGAPATLARVWRSYDVVVDPQTREIGHGDAIDAIDDRGRIVAMYPPAVSATDLAADAKSLAAQP